MNSLRTDELVNDLDVRMCTTRGALAIDMQMTKWGLQCCVTE